MLIFQREYLFIYPAGLIGCLLAGWINGIGSLFYYSALGRIDAAIGQLLYSLYPLFVALWMFFDNQSFSRMTIARLILAVPAIFLLFVSNESPVDWIGVLMMLAAAALYALHLPITQRVLYDLPAPTVTAYTLLAMSAIVVPTFFFSGSLSDIPVVQDFWWPLIGLTLVTFLSRLTLFTGVKHLGGMQTALLGLSELLITVWLAQLWLGESLSWQQWIGAGLLGATLLLMTGDNPSPPKNRKSGWFSWFSASPIRPQIDGSWDSED
jgi:drug/metabolite transporter (DMT)-like permease